MTSKSIKRKTITDKVVRYLLLSFTVFCSLVILVIIGFIIYKGLSPFIKTYEVDGVEVKVNFWKFITGTTYFTYPNNYGALYIIINTIYVTLLALLIAVPISILTALFISKIAPKKIGKVLNAIIELLASIPSVIYGVFGAGIITIIVKNLASLFNYQSAGGLSTLASSLVLAMMIIPTITMVSVTSINAVKKDVILGSLALGASPIETNFKVVLVSAKHGIFSGIILGVGRALGEATAVSMVCGNKGSGPSFNIFDTTKTLTSAMLQNIHESSGLDYDIRFSIGLLLIIIIIVTNLLLNFINKKVGRYYVK